MVARLGNQFRDNSGAEFGKNVERPGSQELKWGLGDYPITPEAHMRHIRNLGDECLREAEQALLTVKSHQAEAQAVFRTMKAYKLLADYYEAKVLAAVAALIHKFGGDQRYRREAEQLADTAVNRFAQALTYIWHEIDHEQGAMKGRWLDGKSYTLPQLIEHEQSEREQLAALFRWENDASKQIPAQQKQGTAPKVGTFAPEK